MRMRVTVKELREGDHLTSRNVKVEKITEYPSLNGRRVIFLTGAVFPVMWWNESIVNVERESDIDTSVELV